MLFQGEEPFHYLLLQKITPSSHIKMTQNIRLNLNKLPHDFFPKQPPKRINSHSQRFPASHFNQFLAVNNTVELKKPRKPASFSRRQSKNIQIQDLREFTCDVRLRPDKRRMTEQKQVEISEFKGTFSRKMYSECSQQKRVQLPTLQSARKRGLNIPGLI